MLDFNNGNLNLIAGIFLLALLVLVSIFYLNKHNIADDYNTYVVNVGDVGGLKLNQNINMGGYPIGYLYNINMDDSAKLNIIIKVRQNIQLSVDSTLKITPDSLFGSSKNISVANGIEEDYLHNNDYITNVTAGVTLDQLLDMITYYLKEKISKK